MDAYESLTAAIKTIDAKKIRYDDPNDNTLKSLLLMYKHKTFDSIHDTIKEKLAEINKYLNAARAALDADDFTELENAPAPKPPKRDSRKKKNKHNAAGNVYYDPNKDYGNAIQHIDIIQDPDSGLFIIRSKPAKE
jgi:hypothetical protein